MPGDNVKQFLNDWDTTCANINNLPDVEFMESMFRRQLEKSIVLKPVLALCWQGITQDKEPKDYKKLKHIVESHLEEQLLRRNQAALSAAPGPKQQMLPAMGDGQVQPRNGLCKKWAKAGECAAGDDCPWAASHTKENKPKGKGKGKGQGKSGDRSTSPSQTRVRAPAPPRHKSPLLKLGAT